MTPTNVFSCEYCEIFKSIFFKEHLRWLFQCVPFKNIPCSRNVNKLVHLNLSGAVQHSWKISNSWMKMDKDDDEENRNQNEKTQKQ